MKVPSVSNCSAMSPYAKHNSNNGDVLSEGPNASSGFDLHAAAPSVFRSMRSPLVCFQSLPLQPSASVVMSNAAYVSSAEIIRAPSRWVQRSYPHPADLVGRDPLDDAYLFAQAPWFDPVALRDDALTNRHVFSGYLPDGLPYGAIRSHDWLTHWALSDTAIARYTNERMNEARILFTNLIYQRLHRFTSTVVHTGDWNLDPWMARTNGEGYSYIESLYEVDVNEWRGFGDVRNAVLCYRRPLLRADFCSVQKREIPYWDYPLRERRTRYRLGYLIPYRMIEIDQSKRNACVGRYVALPEHWAEIESPCGCPVELSPSITYIGSKLINDPFLAYWTVVFSKFIAKMAAYILWDAYDTYRVCIGWHGDPLEPSARGTKVRHRDHSPRRTANAGYFVWYNPWNSQIITSDQDRDLRANPRECPRNQRTGYVYESTPSEFEDQEYEEAPGADAELVFEDEPLLSGTAPMTSASPPTAMASGVNPSMGYHHGFAQEPSDAEDSFLAPLRQFLLDPSFPEEQLQRKSC
ncbi:unnamed protein product [Agarophyton chilense]